MEDRSTVEASFLWALLVLVAAGGAVVSIVVATDSGRDHRAVASVEPAGATPATAPLEAGVLITALGCRLESFGVGVVIDDGIVTNAHVVAGATDVEVHAPGAALPVAAAVVAFDPLDDLALLRTEVPVGRALPVGRARAGSDVVALARVSDDAGTPQVVPIDVHIERLIDIFIADIYGDGRHEREGLELVADIGPGDSGAGLVDSAGAVVGVVFSSSRGKDGVAYATDASELGALVASADDDGVDNGACRR